MAKTPFIIVLGMGGACLTLQLMTPPADSHSSASDEGSHRTSGKAVGESVDAAAPASEARRGGGQLPKISGSVPPDSSQGGREVVEPDLHLDSQPPTFLLQTKTDRSGGRGRTEERAPLASPHTVLPIPSGELERRKIEPAVAAHPDQETSADLEPALAVPYSPFDPSMPATIPAALALMPPNTLDDTGAAHIAQLAETFLGRVEGGTDDPLNSEYQMEWARAQEDSDARMRASLGGHAWLNHHREVHQLAGRHDPPTPKLQPSASR